MTTQMPPTRRSFSAARAAAWLAAGVCLVPVATAQTTGVPVIRAIHEPVFPGSDAVQSVVFSPDSSSLYVHLHVPTLNLWPNLVALWPELLGGLVVIVTMLFLLVILRLRRRARRRGAPYCRRCNYDLTPQVRTVTEADGGRGGKGRARHGFAWESGVMCPECGTPLDRAHPVRGRGFWFRLSPALGAWLAVVLAYGAMFAARLPRAGTASGWIDLSSTWAAGHVDSWALRWLSPKVRVTDQVVEIDPATGVVVQTITTRSSTTYFDLSVSPDGSNVFLARGMDEIVAVDVRTGRTTAVARLPGWSLVDVTGPTVLGFSPDGAHAYAQWWNKDPNTSGVVRWAWRGRRPVERLIEEAGFVRDTARGRTSKWPRIFLLRDHRGEGGAARFLSISSLMEAFPTKKFVVRVFDGEAARTIDVQPMPHAMQSPAVSPDGVTLFLAGEYGNGLLGVDLESGASAVLKSGSGEARTIVRSRAGRYLVLGSVRGILVHDTTAQSWCAKLTLPSSLYAPKPTVSPDGRRVAAVCQGNAKSPAKPGSIVHRVVIWDLGEHRLVEETGAETTRK